MLAEQAGRACLLPPARSPVDLQRLVPRDESVAQQRRDVVGHGPQHRILKIEDARVGLSDHQVARHPVPVHGHLWLGQRAGHQTVAQALPGGGLRRRPVDAVLLAHTPFGKQQELAPQKVVVIGRQAASVDARLKLHQRGSGFAHQPVGLRRLCSLQCLQVQVLP